MKARPSTPDGRGYPAAVLAATLTMLFVLTGNIIFALLTSPIAFVAVVVATFLPAAIVSRTGRRHHLKSLPYFVACSLATGVGYDALLAVVTGSAPAAAGTTSSTHAAIFLRYLPMFVSGGIVGGATYWAVAGRGEASKAD